MIYDCLLVPDENPPRLRDLKRALITYDKVRIVAPEDRDLLPGNAFFSSISPVPFPIGINIGSVRPMGKALGYDERFQRIVDQIKPAESQGLVEIISTFKAEDTSKLSIGSIPTGGYPLNPRFVLWCYRKMAENQDFLSSAISGDEATLCQNVKTISSIALEGKADGKINDIPELPLIDRDIDETARAALTAIARARVGAFIKYAGYCELKELIPVFSSETYAGVCTRLINNTQELLSNVEGDTLWLRRNRILQLCHEEFLDDTVLDKMSIGEVLSLRTKVWGRQAESREMLFSSIASIAEELAGEDQFAEEARKRVASYRQASADLEAERSALRLNVKCDLGIAVLGSGTTTIGLMSQVLSPTTMAVTLAAGGMWALEKTKDYVPTLKKLSEKEKTLRRGAGFGLHNFYSRVGS